MSVDLFPASGSYAFPGVTGPEAVALVTAANPARYAYIPFRVLTAAVPFTPGLWMLDAANVPIPLGGTGPVGGVTSVLTLNPAGPAAPGVYLTWATLYAAYLATTGAVEIVVLSQATVPAGLWTLRPGTILRGQQPTTYTLLLADGAVIHNLVWVIALAIEGLQTTGPSLTYTVPAGPGGIVVIVLQAGARLSGHGTVAMIDWTVPSATAQLFLGLDQGSALARDTSTVLRAGAGASATVITLGGAPEIVADTLEGPVLSTIAVLARDPSLMMGAQPGYLGVGTPLLPPTVDWPLKLILDQTLGIGGASGPVLTLDPTSPAGALAVRNAGDTAYAPTRGAMPVSLNDYTPKAYVDARATTLLASAQHDGTLPLPVSVLGAPFYSVVTTSGGFATIGQMLYDDGLGPLGTVTVLPALNGRTIVTLALFAGAIVLNAQSFYFWDGAMWLLESAPTFNGAVLTIRVHLLFSDWPGPLASLTSILANSIVLRSTVNVLTPFDVGSLLDLGNVTTPTLLQAATDLSVAGIYTPGIDQDEPWLGMTLPLLLTLVGPGPAAGEAYITVEYAMPNP